MRRRRVGKWAGLVACVVILGAWLVSGRYAVWYDTGETALSLWSGALTISAESKPQSGFWVIILAHEFYWTPELTLPTPTMGFWLLIPLWIPFLLLAIPTVILWRRDSRPPPGHCKNCGYDLTGNISGRCPECGEVA